MKAAQELYEGVDVEELGTVGLITYMRTDSLRISDEARAAAAAYIEQTYGKAYIPSTPRIYKHTSPKTTPRMLTKPSGPPCRSFPRRR